MHFAHGEPALLIGTSLVIAELHIGYEQTLFPNTDVFFTDKLISRVRALLKETGAKRLIVNGDVKHSVKGVTPEEGREMAKFFGALEIPTVVVKGNHDGGVERFVHEANVVGQGGLRLEDAAIFHGNAWPSPEVAKGAKYFITAHSHPCVMMGGKSMQCWLIGGLNEKAKPRFPNWSELRVVVMPAFSQLVGCAPVNGRDGRRRLIGPLFRHEMFKLDEAEVYLLYGTPLGRVRDLRS